MYILSYHSTIVTNIYDITCALHKIKLKYTIEQMTTAAISLRPTAISSTNSIENNNSIILQLFKYFNYDDNNNNNNDGVDD